MPQQTSDNKRLAKNTAILYARMAFLMIVSLYTSKIVLASLGVEDFGIYNVVGGFVSMLSIVTSSLSLSISRFITFYIGKKDSNILHKTFCTAVNVQILLATIILFLGEILGYYFLNYKMNMPIERYDAARWVLHCCLLSFAVNLLNVPYNACIIAHERMAAFAYMSIAEAGFKLLVAYLIMTSTFDKLKFYAILMLIISVVIRFLYGLYCSRQFKECKYKLLFDKSCFKQMSNIAGWNIVGQTSYILNTQGVNLLMNAFFGVAINAARGVATQVENAVIQFVNNFTSALNPQITKSYAKGNTDTMVNLVYRGAKFSCFMLLFFLIPLLIETNIILSLWLKEVPKFSIIFLRLTLVASLINISVNTLFTSIVAIGDIKRYSIQVNLLGVLVLPISWLLYKYVNNCPPEVAYYVFITIYIMLIFVKVHVLSSEIPINITSYLRKVILPLLKVSTISLFFSYILHINMIEGLFRLSLVVILSTVSLCVLIWSVGLEQSEKVALKIVIENKYNTWIKKN